jgi:CRISPR-associated protein Csb2
VNDVLLISVEFPRHAYSGGELAYPEPLPSPARLHAAFAAAAAGGSWAELAPDERAQRPVLAASLTHAEAVRFLEEQLPIGLIVPECRGSDRRARRYRLRAARAPYLDDTPFEPFWALGGPVVYVWPRAEPGVVQALAELAREITHVGRAEGAAIVTVRTGRLDPGCAGFMALADGPGPGLVLRAAERGRYEALMTAHRKSLRLGRGRHGTGSRGKQASDEQPEGPGELHTRLARFARPGVPRWPYEEALVMRFRGGLEPWMTRTELRVRFAAAVHRAIVAAIADDVPPMVSGRDGQGPLRGPGHLAIHLTTFDCGRPQVVLAVPTGAPQADRARLLEALADGLAFRFGDRRLMLEAPVQLPTVPFWGSRHGPLATEVPMVLDAPGTPRHVDWRLEDAVLCSVGYAMRGVLEADGFAWGMGWEFRRALVDHLRKLGVQARARRVAGSASRYCHRAREGDLLVAVDAILTLGELAADGGLLAIGRARHLGGGLLRPLAVSW